MVCSEGGGLPTPEGCPCFSLEYLNSLSWPEATECVNDDSEGGYTLIAGPDVEPERDKVGAAATDNYSCRLYHTDANVDIYNEFASLEALDACRQTILASDWWLAYCPGGIP